MIFLPASAIVLAVRLDLATDRVPEVPGGLPVDFCRKYDTEPRRGTQHLGEAPQGEAAAALSLQTEPKQQPVDAGGQSIGGKLGDLRKSIDAAKARGGGGTDLPSLNK